MGTRGKDSTIPHKTVINGSEHPELLPDYVKYAWFFSGYRGLYASYLETTLCPEDDARLKVASDGYAAREAAENARGHQEMVELCARAKTMEPLECIKERELNAMAMNSRTQTHYEEVMRTLTPKGRAIAEEYIDQQIVSQLTGEVITNPLWKTMDEEEARREMELDCYVVENGEYPPDFQKETRRQHERFVAEVLRDEEQSDAVADHGSIVVAKELPR